MNCTKEKMYFLIESLRRNDMNATEIHTITNTAWPNESYSVRHIRKICQEFKEERRDSFERKEGSGSNKSETRWQNVAAVEKLVKEDHRMSIRRISQITSLHPSMVQRIVTEDLERLWVKTKWVPHTLTEANKTY